MSPRHMAIPRDFPRRPWRNPSGHDVVRTKTCLRERAPCDISFRWSFCANARLKREKALTPFRKRCGVWNHACLPSKSLTQENASTWWDTWDVFSITTGASVIPNIDITMNLYAKRRPVDSISVRLSGVRLVRNLTLILTLLIRFGVFQNCQSRYFRDFEFGAVGRVYCRAGLGVSATL